MNYYVIESKICKSFAWPDENLLIFPSASRKVEHAPYMQSQRDFHSAPSADGNLAYAPPAPAALLLLRDILLLSHHLLLISFQHLPKTQGYMQDFL